MRVSHRVAALVLVAAAACRDGGTEPTTGGMTLGADGLTAGAQVTVVVTTPQGELREANLTSGAAGVTLSDLAPGTYGVAAPSVILGGNRYAPAPATQTVTVRAGATATPPRFAYAIASARLAVTITGLPPGAPADVRITGATGPGVAITASQTLTLLDPGTYVIEAGDVQTASGTFFPSPTRQTVTLVSSTMPKEVTVTYGAGTGSLEITLSGLPAGTAVAITVTGPAGYTREVTGPVVIENLVPGDYTVTAAIAGSNLTTHRPSPATQVVAVPDDGSASAPIAYSSEPLTLGVQVVAEGLTNPVYLTAPPGDARLFIVERSGVVRIVKDAVLLPTPFLDIRSRVNSVSERGMLSMTFDPQYASNGFVYVYYTNASSNLVVERIVSTPESDVAGTTGTVVITINHGGENHHGGEIAFGPDGMLYVAPGDGGCCGDPNNNAQNLNTFLGKVLRIDVRALPYTVPATNPFVGHGNARPEIWAYGLRNPWRFSFDAPSDRLYISDVGQDAREEINASPVGQGGANYGWRLMEGTLCYIPSSNCNPTGALTLPIREYPHELGCSVIGGYVYRGTAIPELTGHYLYSDYCAGWLRSFRATPGGTIEHVTWAGIVKPQTVSLGRDGAAELYMIGLGKVWRIIRP